MSLKQLFKVPEQFVEAAGLWIAGGWHNFVTHATHGKVLELPAHGDYSQALPDGFASVPHTEPAAEAPAAPVSMEVVHTPDAPDDAAAL